MSIDFFSEGHLGALQKKDERTLKKPVDRSRSGFRMVQMPTTTSKKTRHSFDCTMAFGRPTKVVGACARCDELRAGAAPREGWGRTRAQRATDADRFRRELKSHDCIKSHCGPVCTAFEW